MFPWLVEQHSKHVELTFHSRYDTVNGPRTKTLRVVFGTVKVEITETSWSVSVTAKFVLIRLSMGSGFEMKNGVVFGIIKSSNGFNVPGLSEGSEGEGITCLCALGRGLCI